MQPNSSLGFSAFQKDTALECGTAVVQTAMHAGSVAQALPFGGEVTSVPFRGRSALTEIGSSVYLWPSRDFALWYSWTLFMP